MRYFIEKGRVLRHIVPKGGESTHPMIGAVGLKWALMTFSPGMNWSGSCFHNPCMVTSIYLLSNPWENFLMSLSIYFLVYKMG